MDVNFIFTNFVAEDTLDLNLTRIENYSMQLKDSYPSRILSNYGGWQSDDLDDRKISSQPGWQSDDLNLASDEIKDLKDSILLRGNNLIKKFGFKSDLYMGNMWVNINQNKDFNKIHMHPNSLLSGVFYVKTPKNCGRIVFKNPNPYHFFFIENLTIHNQLEIERYNGFNSAIWVITPKPNLLLLFPSWLEHHVEPNESNETRISYSFNLKPIGI